MWLHVYFVLSCVIYFVNGQITTACTTPNRLQGACLRLQDCDVLMNILKNPPVSEEDKKFLKASQCGRDGTNPRVCCPLAVQTGPDPTYKPLFEESYCGHDVSDRIIGGNISNIGEYPWMALLEYQKSQGTKFACGGALINKRYVLTAAHCVKGKDLPKSWKLINVRLGEHDLSTLQDCTDDIPDLVICADPAIDVPIETVKVHESYDPNDTSQKHDIALIRLARNVNYTDFVQPICLVNSSTTTTPKSRYAFLAGWGKTENSTDSDLKMKLRLGLSDFDECKKKYKSIGISLEKGQICAGGDRGKDSCKGDSGGPLMQILNTVTEKYTAYAWYATGIVSLGPSPCGSEGWPGVYTKVADYAEWIKSNVVE